MERKQTAVEWFQEQIIKIVNGTCELSEIQIFDQAKQMEKEQIQDAWDKRCSYGVVSQTWRVETTNGEQYYKETYGETK
jgi:hypothetical protein